MYNNSLLQKSEPNQMDKNTTKKRGLKRRPAFLTSLNLSYGMITNWSKFTLADCVSEMTYWLDISEY